MSERLELAQEALKRVNKAEGFVCWAQKAIPALARALLAEIEEKQDLHDASKALLELMTDYYFHADDPELEAVNRLRRLVGMRSQPPKHLGVQADEAEVAHKAGDPQGEDS